MNNPAAVMASMHIQRRIDQLLEEHLIAVENEDWFAADVSYGGIYALGKLAGDLELAGAGCAASQALTQCKPYPRHRARPDGEPM